MIIVIIVEGDINALGDLISSKLRLLQELRATEKRNSQAFGLQRLRTTQIKKKIETETRMDVNKFVSAAKPQFLGPSVMVWYI